MEPPAVEGFAALPTEVLDDIARRAGPLDNVVFSGVCRSWRRALNTTRLSRLGLGGRQPKPHHISLESYGRPAPEIVVRASDSRSGQRNLVRTVVDDAVARTRIIGCSYGWVVTVDDDTWAMYLLEPYTGRTFPLPPFSDALPGKQRREPPCGTQRPHIGGDPRFWRHMFRKAALAPGRRLGTYAVMLLHSNGRGMSYLAPGAASWATVRPPRGMPHKYLDVILHRGAFYTISCYAELNAWVPDGGGGGGLRTTRLTKPVPEPVWAVLAESMSGDGILMVTSTERRENEHTVDDYWRRPYSVHRCVESERRWLPVRDLKKMTILIGEGCSLCVPHSYGVGDGYGHVQASRSSWYLPYIPAKLDPSFIHIAGRPDVISS